MKVKHLLITTMLALFAVSSVQAEEVTEGFESVTIVDADGNPVSSYSYGAGLSNGWKVIGGNIYGGAGSASYGLWSTAYSGSKSLEASYSSTNSAIMVIPVRLAGNISFYARKTSSSSSVKGYVDLWEMEEDGGSFRKVGSSSFKYWTLTSTTWTEFSFDLGNEPRYIGICLSRAAIDDVTYNTASLEPHEHSYAVEWSSDENEHWHACTSEVGICDAKKIDVAAHDGLTCSVCGYKVLGIEAFPWLEDFNGISSGIPAGWDNSEGNTTTASYKWNYYSKSVRFDSYNNSEGKTNVLATPLLYIPSTGVYELKFKVKNPKGGNYSVQIAEYGSAERTILFDNLTNIADWTEKTASLAAYAGKAVKVYFCGTSNWGSGDAYLYLDDVTVKESIAHNHDYADVWSYNYTSHWHACTSVVGECDAPQADLAAHTLDGDGICTVCGYDQPYMVDFESGIPANWTNKGWTIKDNPSYGNGTKMAYAGYYNTNTLTTPRLAANVGDVIDIEALQNYNDEPLTLEYSLDGGETWIQGFSEVPAADNTLHTLHFTAPETGIYILRFSGRYNYIDNICGFKLAQVPVMNVTTTCGAAKDGNAFTDSFGRQLADASHTYTVTNTGAGTLTVAIASDNADFTVSASELTMGAGESKTFDVIFVHSNVFGAKSAAITIDPTYAGLATVTINATADCADPEAFFEDFESGIPASWQNNGWSIQTQSGSKMMYSNTQDSYTLVTPRLQASKDEVLTFDAYQKWDDEPLKLEYSIDGGYTWTVAFEEVPVANNTARQFEFTAPADGYYYLRFSGSYNYIDNVSGFKLAPVTLEESNYAVANKWATLCYPADVTIADGVQAFKIESVEDDVLNLIEIESTIAAGTPVILYSAEAASLTLPAVTLPYLVNQPVKTPGNILVGCYGALTLDDAKQYVLQNQNDVVAFYQVDPAAPFTTTAYRCYLEFYSTQAATRFTINANIDVPTVIRNITGMKSGVAYDLEGREVKTLSKGGIYVINNKKVVIK